MKLFMGAAPKFPWRKSASVVLAAPGRGLEKPELVADLRVENKTDYRICMLKRHGNSSYMGNAVVFPGGVYDAADEVVAGKYWPGVEGAVGKVCAAREAFEEAGVVLFEDETQHSTDEIARTWRMKVHDNGMEYLKMLEGYGTRPAFNSLELWCSFKTPDTEAAKAKKGGFETEFYMACLGEEAAGHLVHDEKEVTELLWLTPDECLAAQQEGRIFLPPPQWTIMSELSTSAPTLDGLAAYAASPSRTLIRDHLIKPYLLVPSPEGTRTMAYPGDQLHPMFPTPNGIRRIHISKNNISMECNLAPDTKLTQLAPEPKL